MNRFAFTIISKVFHIIRTIRTNEYNEYIKTIENSLKLVKLNMIETSVKVYIENDKKESKSSRTIFVQTVAKPDPSLKGIKVSLPKPVINNTWNQITNNEAHRVVHPFTRNNIKLSWKISIGKGQNKKKPISSQPVIDKEKIYTIDTTLNVIAVNKNNGKKKWTKKLKKRLVIQKE